MCPYVYMCVCIYACMYYSMYLIPLHVHAFVLNRYSIVIAFSNIIVKLNATNERVRSVFLYMYNNQCIVIQCTIPELRIIVYHRSFSNPLGIWLTKSNLIGHFFCTFPLGKPLIVKFPMVILSTAIPYSGKLWRVESLAIWRIQQIVSNLLNHPK